MQQSVIRVHKSQAIQAILLRLFKASRQVRRLTQLLVTVLRVLHQIPFRYYIPVNLMVSTLYL